MGKNRLALHSVAVLSILLFAFLALSSGSSEKAVIAAPKDGVETVVSSTTTSNGNVYNLPGPEKRPFDTLGLVFATSVTKYDENGFEAFSEEGVVNLLLREAQKLGGNDILNLRTDENIIVIQTKVTVDGKEKTLTKRTVTKTGSALAIKYSNDPDDLRETRNHEIEAAKVAGGGGSSGGGSGGGGSGGSSFGNLVSEKFTIEGKVDNAISNRR
jgi:hypothetical protein